MTLFITLGVLMGLLALGFVLPGLLRGHPRRPVGAPAAAVQERPYALAVLQAQGREIDDDLRAGTLDAEAYAAAQRDLAQRVLEDVPRDASAMSPPPAAPQKLTSAVVFGLVVVVTVAGYRLVGQPAALQRVQAPAAPEAAGAAQRPGPLAASSGPVTPAEVEAMVARLAARLQTRPDDPEGWRMLARSYETLGRFAQAAAAYERLVKLTPPTADLLCDYAVTLAMSQGQTLAGPPEALIARALEVEPDHIQALALAGSAAYERHDHARAAELWRRLLSLIPQESEMALTIERSIRKAQALAAGKPPP